MKILQLSSIGLDTVAIDFSFSSICKVILLSASFAATIFLIYNTQYIWALAFAALSIVAIHSYRLYEEIIQMDFDIDGVELSLEEIFDELG